MCEDLAEAEMALRAAELLPVNLRAERTAEWTASIDALSAAISKALGKAYVTHLGQPGQSRRRL
jgi:hypothetical protein